MVIAVTVVLPLVADVSIALVITAMNWLGMVLERVFVSVAGEMVLVSPVSIFEGVPAGVKVPAEVSVLRV